MPRLDAFIEKLLAAPAAQLVFETGQGAVLESAQQRVRLLQQPLTSQQIVGAFAEIIPDDLQKGFPRPGTTAFQYRSRAGEVEVHFEARNDRVRARVVAAAEEDPAVADLLSPVVPASRATATPPTATPTPTPNATPTATASLTPTPTPRRRTTITIPPAPAPAVPPAPLEPTPDDPREAIEALLALVKERRASDLHLTSGEVPALRIDGDVVPIPEYGPIHAERLREMLWSIAPERGRAEWEASHDADFAHETEGARYRANVFSDRKGIGAVFRIIPRDILTAEDLGLSAPILDLCQLSKGLVLVTGPTGSGKSTTLAALVDYVNRNRDDHIITIEDPIEFVHQNKRCIVHQREVGTHTDSFKRALRAALREDPDVILVGELRDLETIAIAIETAETGHLVFGTLHTNTAPSTVDRLIDQFPVDRQEQIRMMLSESLKGVVSQTLCKKIGGGRAAALEVLLCTSGVANLIREGKTFQIPSIMQTAKGQGMVTLNDALLDLVKRKVVEPAEAHRKAVARKELEAALERAGFPLDAAAGG
jgi:twitching motility protein PilT